MLSLVVCSIWSYWSTCWILEPKGRSGWKFLRISTCFFQASGSNKIRLFEVTQKKTPDIQETGFKALSPTKISTNDGNLQKGPTQIKLSPHQRFPSRRGVRCLGSTQACSSLESQCGPATETCFSEVAQKELPTICNQFWSSLDTSKQHCPLTNKVIIAKLSGSQIKS